MKLIKIPLLFINLLIAIPLCLSYMSPLTDPTVYYLVSFFGLIYPWLLIANIGFVIMWLFIDYTKLFISLIAIVLGWSYIGTFYTINSYDEVTREDLNILSYNISNGTYYNSENELVENDLSDFSNYISSFNDIDVICIQEGSSEVANILKADYPDYKLIQIDDNRTMILTKLPVIDYGKVDFGQRVNSCTWADVMYDDQKIRLYSTHLQTNSLTRSANSVIKDGDIRERRTWGKIKALFSKYKSATLVRGKQADLIIENMQEISHAKILCGDFNDTPMSFVFNKFSNTMKDSFEEGGSGIGTTFRGGIPLLRIDYIFYSDELSINKFLISKNKFSDHYPIFGSYKYCRIK